MIISIVNHKGGTGKTTTSINLGRALTERFLQISLIDFDAQGSLSYSLGIDESVNTIADALAGECDLRHVRVEREGMDVYPAGRSLADMELGLAKSEDRIFHLRNLLEGFVGADLVLIDCPPSLSILTVNALAASDFVIIPMQMDVLALRGLESMVDTIKRLKEINIKLEVLGVLPVMVDSRKNIHHQILQHIKANYPLRIFNNTIRASVKAAEAPSFGKSVVSYAPHCTTSCDYRVVAAEVLQLLEAMQPASQRKNQHQNI